MLPNITREQGTHIIRYDIAKKKIVNFAPISISQCGLSLHGGGDTGGDIVPTAGLIWRQHGFREAAGWIDASDPPFRQRRDVRGGDFHVGQGDGEVSGNAIEASMAPTIQFIVHKGEGKDMDFPVPRGRQEFRYPRRATPVGQSACQSDQANGQIPASDTACRRRCLFALQHLDQGTERSLEDEQPGEDLPVEFLGAA